MNAPRKHTWCTVVVLKGYLKLNFAISLVENQRAGSWYMGYEGLHILL
jgi:hypothetical protein